jgi:uncharacterized protein (DUF302 family)
MGEYRMNLLRTAAALALPAVISAAGAADGMVAVKSADGAEATMDRLEALVEQRGLRVFARIDHAAGASSVGETLRPTELLIFGSPEKGTPFMECAQTVGIDLPVKALVWEDASGQVWLGYNDPGYLARRHGVPECPVAAKLQEALRGLAASAVAPGG